MTVILDLKPEIEQRVKAEANAHGLSVQDYILNVLERDMPREDSFAMTASPEEWVKAFKDWIRHFPEHPILSDEAISRESIYREREDAQL
jgi:hypothetical protein